MMTVENRVTSSYDSSASSYDSDDEQYNDNESLSSYTDLLVALKPSVNSDSSYQIPGSTPSDLFHDAESQEEAFETHEINLPSPLKRPYVDAKLGDLDTAPIKKAASPNFLNEKSNALPRSSLSRSADSAELHSALKKVKANLNHSSFSEYSKNDDGDIDNDLRCLSWLQEGNLLNGLHPKSNASKSIDVKNEPESVATKQNYDPELLLNSSDPLNVISDVDKGLQKPPYSFSTLIFMAIENSENKMLAVKDIYQWIQDTFPYFQKASIGWKNSVRHNLSLNKSFKKVEKVKCIGKGSLWTVDHDARAGLVQQLRKSSAYHNYQNYPYARTLLKTDSRSKYLKFGAPFGKRDASGRFLPNHDEAEFDVAAAMCSLSSSPHRSSAGRPREACSPYVVRTSPDLLSMWRSQVEPYDYSSENSDDDKSPLSELNRFRPVKVDISVSQILEEVKSQDLIRSGRAHLIRPRGDPRVDFSVDGDYEFDDTDGDEDSDDEDMMHQNMKRLIARENDDALGDSGYAEEGFYRAVALWDHTYSKSIASLVKPKHKREMKGLAGLLHLARAASRELESLNKAGGTCSTPKEVSPTGSGSLQPPLTSGAVVRTEEPPHPLSSAVTASPTLPCQGASEKLEPEKRLCTLDELARVSTLHGAIHAC